MLPTGFTISATPKPSSTICHCAPFKVVRLIIIVLLAILALAVVFILIFERWNASNSIEVVKKPDGLEGPFNAYVYDGDTVYITIDGERQGVRLIGVEAPAIKNDYGQETQCYGNESKSYLINLIGGKEIYLEKDDSQDNVDYYGRLLRYVWYEDQLVNQDLLLNGYAREFTFEKEYKYHSVFAKSQDKARADSVGLWSKCSNN